MTTNNPYQSPNQVVTNGTQSISWRIMPRNWFLFAVLVLVVGIPSLFIPTVELFKGSMSLGRAPVFMGYVGLLMPEYWTIALPIALAHFFGTIVIAFMIDRLIWRYMTDSPSATRGEELETSQITVQ